MRIDVRGPAAAPILVLLPPLGGSSDLFSPFRDRLAEAFRVVTCEPPEVELGGAPGTRSLAGAVLGAVDRVHGGSFFLFGISFGGMLAQWMAIDWPARVERLVLGSTVGRSLDVAEALTLHHVTSLAALLLPNAARRLARQVISDEVLNDPEEEERIEQALRAHPHSRAELMGWLAAAARHDAQDELRAIGCPTLVLSGARDELVPHALQAELALAIHDCEHRIVEQAAHDLTVDAPEATARLVRSFLYATDRVGDQVD